MDMVRQLHKMYGLRPLDEVAQTLQVSPTTVGKLAEQYGVPKLFAREGVMSREEVAEGLGVAPVTLWKWSREGLVPSRTGYKANAPVLYFERGDIDQWLMRPKPAWMLVKPEQVGDPLWGLLLRNSQEVNRSPWLALAEAAETYFVHPKTLIYHIRKKRLGAYKVQGRFYVFEPDVRARYDTEFKEYREWLEQTTVAEISQERSERKVRL